MRALFIAGGSGGHLMPLVAVMEELRILRPDIDLHVCCTARPDDQDVLRRRGIPFTVLPTLRRSLSLPLDLLRSIRLARAVLAAFRPDVVFSKGGATGLPIDYLAHRRGIPLILHESDAVMGRANRFAQKWADRVWMGFPSMNPIRPEVLRGTRAEGLRITGFSGTRPILLVMGGSQGAAVFNEAVRDHLPPLLVLCDVIHITGKGKSGAPAQAGYWSRPFVDAELPHLLACADLALSRSGASSIAELAAHGIPTILVPLRGLAQDHQMANARVAEQTAGCILLQQEFLQKELVSLIRQLLDDEGKRRRMKEGMQSIANTSAARHIAENIVEYLASTTRGA